MTCVIKLHKKLKKTLKNWNLDFEVLKKSSFFSKQFSRPGTDTKNNTVVTLNGSYGYCLVESLGCNSVYARAFQQKKRKDSLVSIQKSMPCKNYLCHLDLVGLISLQLHCLKVYCHV